MGWNFGGIILDCEISKLGESLDPELRHQPFGGESAEELRAMQLRDGGAALFEALGIPASYGDAPISFDDATRFDFSGYAVGTVGARTIAVSKWLGMDQDTTLREPLERLSSRWGDVLAFSFDDHSGTYVLSVFRGGARVRFRSCGEGLVHVDEGAPVSGEPPQPETDGKLELAVLEAFTGHRFAELLELKLEMFVK